MNWMNEFENWFYIEEGVFIVEVQVDIDFFQDFVGINVCVFVLFLVIFVLGDFELII